MLNVVGFVSEMMRFVREESPVKVMFVVVK